MINPLLAALVKPDGQPCKGSYQGALSQVRFPLLCTPKIDGIRCRVFNNKGWSRALKPIPNRWIQTQLGQIEVNGLDGELVGTKEDNFHNNQSEIMSQDGTPDFVFYLFDWCDEGQEFVPYDWRLTALSTLEAKLPEFCRVLPATRIDNLDALLAYQDNCIQAGFEGWCGRKPTSIYKGGRSTFTQQYLLKGKMFEDAEAIIIDWLPLLKNQNPAELNPLGYLSRPKRQEGLVEQEKLGAFVVQDVKTNLVFNVGGGYTEEQRVNFWQTRESLRNAILTYRHQPYGRKDRPRIPTFKAIRYDL